MRPWYAIRTKYRSEKAVKRVLEEKSITCYLPSAPSLRRWSDRRKIVEAPLFPSYIFVQPEYGQFPALDYVPGSCGVVAFSGKPAIIRSEEIEALRILVSSKLPMTLHESILVGERIEIISGPLKGAEGCLAMIKNQKRFVINAVLLNQSVSVEVSCSDVRKIP